MIGRRYPTLSAYRARGRGFLARMRGARRIALSTLLLALHLPFAVVTGQAQILTSGGDDPIILCRANGDMLVVTADGSSAPAELTYDCCVHCLAAASAVGLPQPSMDRLAFAATPLHAVMLPHISSPVRAGTALTVHARGPPRVYA